MGRMQRGHRRCPPEVWRRLGAAVGTARFAEAAMALVAATIPRDMEWFVIYRLDRPPEVCHHEVVAEPGSGINRDRIRRSYDAGFFRFDPFYRYWREEGRPGVVTMRAAAGESAGDETYMLDFMPTTGMDDDVAVLLDMGGGGALALCLERRSRFTPAELARLESFFPLLAGLAESHRRYASEPQRGTLSSSTTAPIDFNATVSSFLPGALTPRERQIVHLVLGGLSTDAIARHLGISTGTVKNHRKRLHTKLGIGSERELFGLFLDHLVGLNPPELL